MCMYMKKKHIRNGRVFVGIDEEKKERKEKNLLKFDR